MVKKHIGLGFSVFTGIFVAALIFLPISTSAVTTVEGENFTGVGLLQVCSAEQESTVGLFDKGICLTYLLGVSQTLSLLSGVGAQVPYGETGKYRPLGGSCMPKEVSVDQLRMVWLKYARSHPEALHNPAVLLLLNAFNEAWPC